MSKNKTSKYRGSRTCGCGNSKRGRGAGNRGGHGNAGSFKHHKVRAKKMGLTFGKYGFKRPPSQVSQEKTINVGDLDYLIPQLLSKGLIKDEGDYLHIDLSTISVDKILGSGQLKYSEKKLRVIAKNFSERAVEKIKKLGGEVILDEG
ncbi:MAG: 50S ribosomal protein L15 [Candidatus Methanoliparum thermophilum]|uniref:Large ribosomal subunit protein uL15 n=1 Tax=Methanoliparum thermophilum TaxID=2491083 RepID=A0A520KTV3_METT2|nr:uL15m family ribosomal protein [Candidatus Methanoliparum sp. LAM-1]RZN65507.1 MAG: 50S ribosomal protein L15 [Candidatus Methanoliparum thermophilum]BDC35398.1 50S ribosomal protein L15 [Candidatus Methanoliparum sp. LAM-1]